MKKAFSLLLILIASIIIPVFAQTKSQDSIGNNLQAPKELVHEIPFPGKKTQTSSDSSLIVLTMNPDVQNFLDQGNMQMTSYIIGGLAVIVCAIIVTLYKRWENKRLKRSSGGE